MNSPPSATALLKKLFGTLNPANPIFPFSANTDIVAREKEIEAAKEPRRAPTFAC